MMDNAPDTINSQLGKLEKLVRDSAPMEDRFTDSVKRVGNMCSEKRPPAMSIPVQWHDDDIYIITALKDGQQAVMYLRAIIADFEANDAAGAEQVAMQAKAWLEGKLE